MLKRPRFIWPVEFEAGKIDVYMCSGNNGAAALPPDEAMIHAAKLAAVDFGFEEPPGRRSATSPTAKRRALSPTWRRCSRP